MINQRYHHILFVALFIGAVLGACQITSPDREQMLLTIERMETDLGELFRERGRTDITLERASELRDAYLNFADTFPGDSLSAEFLFQAAMVDADIHDDVSTGIQYLERLVDEYPNHQLNSKTLFLIGFTYAEQLNDYTRAREAYNRYLDKYPDGEMAESVRIELETLGMRPLLD